MRPPPAGAEPEPRARKAKVGSSCRPRLRPPSPSAARAISRGGPTSAPTLLYPSAGPVPAGAAAGAGLPHPTAGLRAARAGSVGFSRADHGCSRRRGRWCGPSRRRATSRRAAAARSPSRRAHARARRYSRVPASTYRRSPPRVRASRGSADSRRPRARARRSLFRAATAHVHVGCDGCEALQQPQRAATGRAARRGADGAVRAVPVGSD